MRSGHVQAEDNQVYANEYVVSDRENDEFSLGSEILMQWDFFFFFFCCTTLNSGVVCCLLVVNVVKEVAAADESVNQVDRLLFEKVCPFLLLLLLLFIYLFFYFLLFDS